MRTLDRRDAGRRMALAVALVGLGLLAYAVPETGGPLGIVLAALGAFRKPPLKGA